jgi:hypothetical protein
MAVEERPREEYTSRSKDSLKTSHTRTLVGEHWTVWLSWIVICLRVPLNSTQKKNNF